VITINIEILSSLVDTLENDSKSDTVVLEQEIEEGATIRDILNRLSVRHQRFVEVVFDIKAQKQTDRVNIFLNGRNIELINGLATELSDGDTLTFIAPIVGG
jgi:MoaD family protein